MGRSGFQPVKLSGLKKNALRVVGVRMLRKKGIR
jgi:hypothetical protein